MESAVPCTAGRRADGRPAKPDLCSEWPPKNQGLHPGCVFARPRRRGPELTHIVQFPSRSAVLMGDPAGSSPARCPWSASDG